MSHCGHQSSKGHTKMTEQRKLAAVMFTDIAGYTALMSKDEQKAMVLLKKNRKLQKSLTKKHNGEFLKEMGDGTLLCFQSALDAVKCAMEIQESVKDDADLHLRIGIHLGDIVFKDEDVFGDGVNVASRIETLAETGGICISEEVYRSVRNQPNIQVEFRGEEQLKNVDHLVKIYKIITGTEQKRSVQEAFIGPKHNMPKQFTSFVGRSKEMGVLNGLLTNNRLVTVIGAGGCGKTRVSLEVIAKLKEGYKDGLWFINLTTVTDPNFVTEEIIKVLGIKQEPDKEAISTLIENIENKSLLILLDNCEHLVQGCTEVAAKLLQSVKGVKILATSREALHIPGEVVWRAPSLAFPDDCSNMDIGKVLEYEAIKLFTDRACISNPEFTLNPQNTCLVAQICKCIAGIPLAIELAASRIRHMGLQIILERLEGHMKILATSSKIVPKRQQTLKAAIDWSYDLLSDEEQCLFSRLSVFNGIFSLQAAEEVCSGDKLENEDILAVLSQLVDKSIVLPESRQDESVGYRFLEPLRQYSLQKLHESGEEEKYRKSHLQYYIKMANQAYDAQFEAQLQWVNKLELEYDNLLAALNWSETNDPEGFVQLAGALAWYWRHHTHFIIAKDFLERALAKPFDKTEVYARVLHGLGMILSYSGDRHRIINLFKESLALSRQFKNSRDEAMVLGWLGARQVASGEQKAGSENCEESIKIARTIGDQYLINSCLVHVCGSLAHSKMFKQARPMAESLLVSSEKLGHAYGIEAARHYLGDCEFGEGNYKEAEKKYALVIKTALEHEFPFYAVIDMQGVAFALSAQSRLMKTIRLDAAAREEAKKLGASLDGIVQFWDEWIDTYIEGAKKKLGEELTLKYTEEGRNMGFEAAIAYALDFDKD